MEIPGTVTNDTLKGTIGSDTIVGLEGNDLIFGSSGTDSVNGGAGDDMLYFRFAYTDILNSPVGVGSVTFVLGPDSLLSTDGSVMTHFTEIENVGFSMLATVVADVTFDMRGFTAQQSESWFSYVLTGAGNDTIFGSAGNDFLNAREGQNWIDAGAGTDKVYTYLYANADHVLLYGDATSLNVVQGGVTLLTALNAEFVGVNAISGSFDRYIDASGLVGVRVSMISGVGGDTLIGSAQNDEFIFDTNATFTDTLTGGGGNDVYDFSEVTASFDNTIITDFNAGDFIDLLNITIYGDGNYSMRDQLLIDSFHFGSLTGAAGELAYHWASGQTIVEYDLDGDGVADQTLVLASGELTLEMTYESVSQNGPTFFAGIVALESAFDVTLTDGDDAFVGSSLDDKIRGIAGNDVLEGAGGNDIVNGGAGSDTASYATAASAVMVSLGKLGQMQNTLGAGADMLIAIENLAGSAFADRLTGNAADNKLLGLAGDDVLEGFAGNDLVEGGDGNDLLTGATGIDRLYGGAGNDRLFGGSEFDRLFGDAGKDYLDGGSGADRLTGGAGDDVYIVDALGDVVVELAGEGSDLVRAKGVSVTLGANVERLEILSGAVNGTGNGLANGLIGSAANNVLSGLAGNDGLRGGAGADTLYGGMGNDTLFGGAGIDVLTGGEGADRFVFEAVTESWIAVTIADRITDFVRGTDSIVLTAIDANSATTANDAFTFIGTAAFSHTAGELRYRYDGQGNTHIQIDVDGDGVADMGIRLDGEIALQASDFLL